MIASHETFQLPDWTADESYDYTNRLSLREFAWEFLRRNADFRGAWTAAQLEYGVAGYDGPTTFIVSQHNKPSLAQWGCLYASSPSRDALTAMVLWCPDACATVLRLTAFALDAKIDATPFLLRTIDCPSLLLELPQGPQHLLFVEGGRGLQLSIEGADIVQPVRLMTNCAPDDVLAGPQMRSLQCFNDLRLTGHFFRSNVQRDPLSPRFRRVLRILDGNLSGATNQEIAKVVLRDEYSDAEWNAPSYSMRDRIRKALARGHFLMREGYRKLQS